MGFLNSIFSKKEETLKPSPLKIISEKLRAVGVTEAGSLKLADDITKSDDIFLHLDATDSIFPQSDTAEKAFKAICPFFKQKKVSLSLKNFNPDVKTTLFDNLNANVEKLTVTDCSFGKKDWDKITSVILNKETKEIVFKDIEFPGDSKDEENKSPFFRNFLAHVLDKKNSLDSLTLDNCGLDRKDLAEVGLKVKESHLKRLDVSNNCYKDENCEGYEDIINALPNSIESLAVRNIPMGGDQDVDFPNFVLSKIKSKIRNMPNLKALDLSKCSLEDDDLHRFLCYTPRSLETLNLDGNYFSDQGLRLLVAQLQKPECHIHTTNVTDSKAGRFSESLVQALKEAEEANKSSSISDIQKEKAKEIACIKSQKTAAEKLEEISGDNMNGKLFHTALQTNQLEEAFQKMTKSGKFLTLEELGTKNEAGKTFLQACADKKKTLELMRPELHDNAKVYQVVYDSLSRQEKGQFDGQEGRQSFIKLKGQLMANAVKAAIAVKAKQGR